MIQIRFSNFNFNSDEEKKEFILSGNNSGPWDEANKFCVNAQNDINYYLLRAKNVFHIDDVNFGDSGTISLSEDIEKLFKQLSTAEERHNNLIKLITEQCETYFKEVMIPKLYQLEMIILLQAFNLKGKPIIDVFQIFDNETQKRRMRNADEFCYVMAGAGGFMALFYKVGTTSILFTDRLSTVYVCQ